MSGIDVIRGPEFDKQVVSRREDTLGTGVPDVYNPNNNSADIYHFETGPDGVQRQVADSIFVVTSGQTRRAHRSGQARRRATAHAPDRVIVPFPYYADGLLWDLVTIDGTQWPGLCKVSGKGCEVKLDSRSGPGRSGARHRHKGYEPGEFDLTLIAWTAEDFEALETLIPSLHPRFRAAQRSAVAIYHPTLALLLVNQVIVKGIAPLVPGSTDGTWEQKLSLVEYSLPRAAPTVALASAAARRNSFDRDTAFPAPLDAPATALPPSQTGAHP